MDLFEFTVALIILIVALYFVFKYRTGLAEYFENLETLKVGTTGIEFKTFKTPYGKLNAATVKESYIRPKAGVNEVHYFYSPIFDFKISWPENWTATENTNELWNKLKNQKEIKEFIENVQIPLKIERNGCDEFVCVMVQNLHMSYIQKEKKGSKRINDYIETLPVRRYLKPIRLNKQLNSAFIVQKYTCKDKKGYYRLVKIIIDSGSAYLISAENLKSVNHKKKLFRKDREWDKYQDDIMYILNSFRVIEAKNH